MSNEVDGLSRRSFLKGAMVVGAAGVMGSVAAGTAFAAGSGSASASASASAPASTSGSASASAPASAGGSASASAASASASAAGGMTWDKECEVLVMGTGASGLSTAINAARAGAKVLVIEKAPQEEEGGNTRVSGNVFTFPTDEQQGYDYYIAESMGARDEMIPTYLKKLCNTQMTIADDFLATLPDFELTPVEMFSPEQEILGGGIQCYINQEAGSGKLWQSLRDGADAEEGIEFMYQTAGQHLIMNEAGEVIGVVATTADGDINIKASKAVVVATGGYEFNYNMMENSYPGWPTFSRGTPYNTGDGIKMCQEAGAQLWHMNASDAGGCCMKCPGLSYNVGDYDCDNVTANVSLATNTGFIYVDAYGKRFMPEDRPDRHGYGHREYIYWYDGVNCEWPNLPWWAVFGEATAQAGAIAKGSASSVGPNEGDKAAAASGGMPIFTWFAAHSGYSWSADNQAEVEAGWILKADTLEALADAMNAFDGEGNKCKVDAATLAQSVADWDAAVAAGADDQFGRQTLVAIGDGPYYAVLCYPTEYNTQGGPKRNENCETLDAFDQPIPRLYNVGECGAVWNWMYNGGCNIAECMTNGVWVGPEVAALTAWDA